MLGKYWKKICIVILIIACLFNIVKKLVQRNSLKEELQATFNYKYNQEIEENKTFEDDKEEDNDSEEDDKEDDSEDDESEENEEDEEEPVVPTRYVFLKISMKG